MHKLLPLLSTNAVSTHNVAALGPVLAHWLLNLLIAVFGASHLLSISLPGLCPHQGAMCAAGGLPLGCNRPEALAQGALHECLLHVDVWLLFAEVSDLLVEGDVVGMRWLNLNPAIYSADFSHTWAGEKSRSPRTVVYVGC